MGTTPVRAGFDPFPSVTHFRRRLHVGTRARWAIILFCLVAIAATAVIFWPSSPTAEQLIDASRTSLVAGDAAEALRLAGQALERSPDDLQALLLAAQAAEQEQRPADALRFLRRLPDGGDRFAAIFAHAANIAWDAGRASDAEFFLRRSLRLEPQQVELQRRLAELLNCEGRRWEAAEPLWQTVRLRRYSLDDLALLANLDQLHECDELVTKFLEAVPEDPVPLVGPARIAVLREQLEEAERLLRQVVAVRPDVIEAQAILGELLVERGRDGEFLQWHQALPEAAEEHPGIWMSRAQFLQRRNDLRGAIRCYWEAARRDPNHRIAHYQLSNLLLTQGDKETAELFAARAERLEALAKASRRVLLEGPTQAEFVRAAKLTEELGRLWEAWAWHLAITTYFPSETWARTEAEKLEKRLGRDVPRTLIAACPAHAVNLAEFRLRDWNSFAGTNATTPMAPNGALATSIRFMDSTAATGLDFTYDNGSRPGEAMQIHQVVGGGVAVIDYDLDGWPDLYFPQAGSLTPADAQSRANRLFRNLGDGRFADVTSEARIGDTGFGLGATVGDFDNDGWPDLYTANIGRNRLFRNNADGTFSDGTDSAGITAEQWTSCTLIVDLNGDGHTDLFDVNYCGGQEPFTRQCHDDDFGLSRSCRPILFAPDQDRILLSNGEGSFRDVTEETGLVGETGRGLGVVAFDPTESGRLDLFIANDMTANAYWINGAVGTGAMPAFRDEAIVSGLAFDFDGLQQASMGIAADDADGDGLLDFFVTNFYKESNTLYLQQSRRAFTDASRQSHVRDASYLMLGFGTQFLDADLDGWPDLVVANGHIDDYSIKGTPFQMKPQFLRNEGGRFAEIPQERLGPYFEKRQLGRGLARIDWNRDRRDDFVVSHLHEPAAILTNACEDPGDAIALRIVGTTAARDAIGTIARFTAGGVTRTKQLTAGDGYQSSNERRLVVGLGRSRAAEQVVVLWPSGRRQEFHNVAAGAEYVAVEGRDTLTPIVSEPARKETLETAGR